jgi:hypothetical protein
LMCEVFLLLLVCKLPLSFEFFSQKLAVESLVFLVKMIVT